MSKPLLKQSRRNLPPPPVSLRRTQTHHNESVPLNGTMMQFFEWHVPSDQKHWDRLQERAAELKKNGVTAVWIPPPTKGASKDCVGYAIYDLWDLGEFDQKNTVGTKYGTKESLKKAINACVMNGIHVYADAVLNHKLGADKTETFRAVEVARDDTTHDISGQQEIKGWTKFEFPGRGDKYSSFKWNFNHFTGVDYNAANKRQGIYRILGDGKYWSDNVDNENGNYDYLLGADLDTAHPEVAEELKKWGVWVINELNLSGFRLDAVKHIDAKFMAEFLEHCRSHTSLGQNMFAVAEYWKNSMSDLEDYLDVHDWKLSLFDVPLHFNFAEAAAKGRDYDMTKIFDGSLVQAHPMQAVTFVVSSQKNTHTHTHTHTHKNISPNPLVGNSSSSSFIPFLAHKNAPQNNHDTQPGESLASWIPHWFQPHAYALILLRRDGYPCVFYGDVYGISGAAPVEPLAAPAITNIMKVRAHFAYGDQDEYLDHPNTIGWVRRGDEKHPQGCAVVLCAGDEGHKHMFVGEAKAGERWVDVAGGRREVLVIGEDGSADFPCNGGAVSAWVRMEEARDVMAWKEQDEA
ncbi:alpha amylase [Fimicolochytrium jonesii]|uniref:alpha amylase n=1 Tax=Fimicolochytrium jonesii TaxID=1396493 RepID=UPI0022FF34AF|nr:alpha amylase [Fimicolochytrium jonesii]KAI8825277.1 alpha amylase [Fimicolochytrium jonesii]